MDQEQVMKQSTNRSDEKLQQTQSLTIKRLEQYQQVQWTFFHLLLLFFLSCFGCLFFGGKGGGGVLLVLLIHKHYLSVLGIDLYFI